MPGQPIAIMHLITELSIGGAQSALLRLLDGQQGSVFVNQVACLYNSDGASARKIRAMGIPVHDLGMRRKYRLDALWRLICLLRRVRPHILVTWLFHADQLGRLAGRAAGVPVIISSRRNVEIGGEWRERLNRWTSPASDRVVAVCEAARQAEIKRAGLPPERVVTIYNGLDEASRQRLAHADGKGIRREWNIPPDAPLVLAIGRLVPQKAPGDVLLAFSRLAQNFPQAHLLFVGDGPLQPQLEEQAANTALAQHIHFAGWQEDVTSFYAASDILVLASLWEGLPNVVLEAMAAARPVVATAVGGTPDLVLDGFTGLLVHPGDPAQLASAIEKLLADPQGAAQMGRAGQERVLPHFSAENMTRQFENLYDALLQEKGLC